MTVRDSAIGQFSNLTGQIGKSVVRHCRVKHRDVGKYAAIHLP